MHITTDQIAMALIITHLIIPMIVGCFYTYIKHHKEER